MAYYLNKYRSGRGKKTPFQKFVIYSLLILIGVALVVAFRLYNALFGSNVWLNDGKEAYVCIPTGADFEKVKAVFYSHGLIVDRTSFEWLAGRKQLVKNFKPGRYKIVQGMSNLSIIRMIGSGRQEPVKLIFNNMRTKDQFAGRIAQQIEADSVELLNKLNDSAYLTKFGLNPQTAVCLFIPNTYEFYWNTSADAFIDKMYKEFNVFWNEKRKAKAQSIGLSIPQVVTLASIVEQETNKNTEKSRIAGVYMNRIKGNWPLQADPTLKFALGDFSIRRILNVHKEIESPYNTYKYAGLPPGPICIPSIASIDATLNYEKHNYFFFCADSDMSGSHVFTANYEQQMLNAEKYRNALNRMQIYK
jgi:UPF0755 protein